MARTMAVLRFIPPERTSAGRVISSSESPVDMSILRISQPLLSDTRAQFSRALNAPKSLSS